LELLRYYYAHRLEAAREAHARGIRVVGLVGSTIPRELVLACDFFPVHISATSGAPTPRANVYMEDVISPETKSLFELAVSGELEFLDLLVLSRPYAQLYYYLKEVYRLGRAPRLPVLHMFDLMQSQREAVRVYNEQQVAALTRRLERVAGRQVVESALRSAIQLTNRVRGLQRELIAGRWESTLSGADALQALGAGYFMAPDAYAEALSTVVSELAPDADLERRPRVLVLSSEPLSDLHLHRALEAAGALVVAEDDWWGSRAPGADIPPDTSILGKYWLDTASPQVTPAEAREAWFRTNAVRDEVDGVVFYLPPSDRQLGWDFPRLKAWLDAQGKPTLRLRSNDELGGWLETLVRSGVAGR
jgi:benzoyl-CoA reductase/2-hydroxyglutaryl-CoA dehydratase subunit BcrC/BadD/HgdB